MALDSMGRILSRPRRAQGMVGTWNRPETWWPIEIRKPHVFAFAVTLHLPAIFPNKYLTIRSVDVFLH